MKLRFSVLGVLFLCLISACSGAESKQAAQAPSASVNAQPSVALIKQVVRSFFQEYTSCQMQPVQDDDWNRCQKVNANADASLVKNLRLGGVEAEGADPVLCAQNTPSKITVSRARVVNQETAQAMVTQQWSGYTTSLMVYLKVSADGTVLVSNVVCG